MADYTFTEQEIKEGKTMAVIAYFGILGWLIAYLTNKDNRYTLYHAQQALIPCIALILTPIPILGQIIFLVAVVLCIMGIVKASGGEAVPLPIVGDWATKLNIFKG